MDTWIRCSMQQPVCMIRSNARARYIHLSAWHTNYTYYYWRFSSESATSSHTKIKHSIFSSFSPILIAKWVQMRKKEIDRTIEETEMIPETIREYIILHIVHYLVFLLFFISGKETVTSHIHHREQHKRVHNEKKKKKRRGMKNKKTHIE